MAGLVKRRGLEGASGRVDVRPQRTVARVAETPGQETLSMGPASASAAGTTDRSRQQRRRSRHRPHRRGKETSAWAPTPTNPVINPTIDPATTTLATVDILRPSSEPRVTVGWSSTQALSDGLSEAGSGLFSSAGAQDGRLLCAAAAAVATADAMRSCHRALTLRRTAIIMTTAKAANRTSGLTDRFRRVPSKDPARPDQRQATIRARPARQ